MIRSGAAEELCDVTMPVYRELSAVHSLRRNWRLSGPPDSRAAVRDLIAAGIKGPDAYLFPQKEDTKHGSRGELMGDTEQMVLKVYSHILDEKEDLDAAIGALERMLS